MISDRTLRKIIRIILIISFVSISRGASAVEQSKTLLRVCKGNTDFLPFMSLKGDGRWQKLIKSASANLPIDVIIHEVPRGRCIIEVQNNSFSDAFFSEPSPELRPTVSFPVNARNELDKTFIVEKLEYIVVIHKNSSVNWDGNKFSNLNNNIIAIQRGRKFIADLLDKMGVTYDISNMDQNFEKLKKKRIAGVIIEFQQYEQLKKKHPDYDFKVLPIQFANKDIYLGVSTPFYLKNKSLVDQLWQSMKSHRNLKNKNE